MPYHHAIGLYVSQYIKFCRETVLTILSDETFGPQSLRFVRRRSHWHAWERLKVLEYTQPLILLTKHMPGQFREIYTLLYISQLHNDVFAEIAEWVLNKCALSRTQPRPIDSSLSHSGDHNVLREANQMEAVAVFSQQYHTEETDFGGLQHMISIEGNKTDFHLLIQALIIALS